MKIIRKPYLLTLVLLLTYTIIIFGINFFELKKYEEDPVKYSDSRNHHGDFYFSLGFDEYIIFYPDNDCWFLYGSYKMIWWKECKGTD